MKSEELVKVSLESLLDLRKNANLLFLDLKANKAPAGKESLHLLARGMEFSETRRYIAGDDARNIDWKVTARTGKAHTKLFAEEKESAIAVVVDLRKSMFFASRGVFKSVKACQMAAIISWNAFQKKKNLMGSLFNEEAFFQIPKNKLNTAVVPFLQLLATKANEDLQNRDLKNLSLDDTLENLRTKIEPGSILYLISDFRKLSDKGITVLKQLAKQSVINLCFIFDPLEKQFPKDEYYPVTDLKNDKKLNTYYKSNIKKYKQQFEDRKEKIESLKNFKNIRFIECSTDDEIRF